MVMTGNSQIVEDFDWEKTPGEEPATQGADGARGGKGF